VVGITLYKLIFIVPSSHDAHHHSDESWMASMVYSETKSKSSTRAEESLRGLLAVSIIQVATVKTDSILITVEHVKNDSEHRGNDKKMVFLTMHGYL
jgi:hypothetical protein